MLNQAARDISGCSSVQEVLEAGAMLLTRVEHSGYAAVSAPGSRGELQFASVAGISTTRQAQLRRVLRKFVSVQRRPFRPQPHRPRRCDGHGASIPIVYRQMMLGAAVLASDDPHSELPPDESGLIDNIVSQLGVALDGVCRYDDARFLADNDALTGLANRRTITERLEQEIVRTQRAGSYFALLMMDVDKFKFCNDTYGHAVGDQVLVATAGALIQAVRAGDVVGRFGGDEFVAILPDTDLAGASYVVERISKCLDDHAVRVSGEDAVASPELRHRGLPDRRPRRRGVVPYRRRQDVRGRSDVPASGWPTPQALTAQKGSPPRPPPPPSDRAALNREARGRRIGRSRTAPGGTVILCRP